jgi:hypothetical protein
MGLSELFGFKSAGASDELPEIFPMPISQSEFVETDVVVIYSKILTDVVERTQGISADQMQALWDNCLPSESSDGLVSMLSKAMAAKKDLFLVWDKALTLLRVATQDEQKIIKEDYSKQGTSKAGVFVSFRNYKKTDMVKLYSSFEYCSIASLNKSMNLSKAIQFKMHDMRGSVSLADSGDVKTQASAIAKGLGSGKDVLVDAKDIIETATPDVSSTEKSMEFINNKRSFYLGMPASYITGEAPKGLGDSGEGDAKAVERGLKNYYFSIIKPVVEALFGTKTTFKSDDFKQLSTALDTLKTFELTSSEMISADNKRIILNKLFGLPVESKGDEAAVAPPEQTNPMQQR